MSIRYHFQKCSNFLLGYSSEDSIEISTLLDRGSVVTGEIFPKSFPKHVHEKNNLRKAQPQRNWKGGDAKKNDSWESEERIRRMLGIIEFSFC